ncbi:IS4 family transposase [Pseudoduganella lutea]|uniref:IS4 family transposase n=1 Tax=Pseudoduganella lutea TaxID=321985 RepID=A0A4P6KV80_9BURK|nr:IS4 family transposase [Pseudoduganella lutea]QBE62038.1 IS4 family transposase [Pseudoduganella lutea]QBE62634.1 IS4 family transposase [Pseudoduganella lutea]QBE63377.1 IS4 family transposase [Pseudoduganella lutea]
MHQGKLVFAQIMTHLPLTTFRRCVAAHQGHYKVKTFSCLDQFLAMAFAQLTYRESLRDIELNLRAQAARLYHMGFRCKTISRSTLADANETRPWQIYADLAAHLIGIARPLYVGEELDVDLKNTVYAFDSTTIDLCLSVYPWAPFKSTKAAIKLHTLLDLRGSIPSFIHISDGKMSDVRGFDRLTIEPGAFYLLDRGYLDFERLYNLNLMGAFFVSRARSNTKLRRRYSHSVDCANTNVECDQTVVLAIPATASRYPDALRRVVVKDETGKRISFLTNNFSLSPETIAGLYKQRWQVELFFKWIKQHLRIKAFYGTSENAVKTQIWIAIATYVLIAIAKKRLQLPQSLYEILQILNLAMFETSPLNQLLSGADNDDLQKSEQIQLALL